MAVLKKMFLKIDFSLIWKGIRYKGNREKNTNIAFNRTEVTKNFEITATFFFFFTPMWLKLLGEKKELLMHCCLSDGLYPRQAGFNDVCSFSCMVLANVINITPILSLLSLFTASPPPPFKWNAKFCHLGVVIIITAEDIARGRNRTGSRKMWPKVHDFSSSCDS